MQSITITIPPGAVIFIMILAAAYFAVQAAGLLFAMMMHHSHVSRDCTPMQVLYFVGALLCETTCCMLLLKLTQL